MKYARILLILYMVLVLLPLSSSAWMGSLLGSGGGQSTEAPACADSSCTGFLVCQNFEGTGYDNSESWSETGTPDEDNTSTPMRGSQQLYTNSTSDYTVKSFTASDEVYVHFLFRHTYVTGGAASFFYLLDGSDNVLVDLQYVVTTNYLKTLTPYSAPGAEPDIALTTPFHIWVRYKKGSGSDAIVQVWASESTTFPGSGSETISVTNGTATAQAAKIKLYGSLCAHYFDQVLVKTSSIGTVCD